MKNHEPEPWETIAIQTISSLPGKALEWLAEMIRIEQDFRQASAELAEAETVSGPIRLAEVDETLPPF